jgi:hypothetical protein
MTHWGITMATLEKVLMIALKSIASDSSKSKDTALMRRGSTPSSPTINN